MEFEAIITLIDEPDPISPRADSLPGSNSTGTSVEPADTKVERGDFDRFAMFFGQLVWYAVMTRPERWASGAYQFDGRTSEAAPTFG